MLFVEHEVMPIHARTDVVATHHTLASWAGGVQRNQEDPIPSEAQDTGGTYYLNSRFNCRMHTPRASCRKSSLAVGRSIEKRGAEPWLGALVLTDTASSRIKGAYL